MKWYEMVLFVLILVLITAIITYYYGSIAALFCLAGMILGMLMTLVDF
jgi:hypothetical protein